MIRVLAVTIALVLATGTAEARHRHHHSYHYQPRHSRVTQFCGTRYCTARRVAHHRRHYHRHHRRYTRTYSARRHGYRDRGVTFLPHPAGCPATRFCGCGLRKFLGISDSRLNVAWNWTKLYRGSMSVAVWHHHVAGIIRRLGNGLALVRDYNSGGHRSRIHVRSIAGARIVGGYR